MGVKPINIKEKDIKAYHDSMVEPISYDYFKIFIQSLDDVFVQYSMEQLKNGH